MDASFEGTVQWFAVRRKWPSPYDLTAPRLRPPGWLPRGLIPDPPRVAGPLLCPRILSEDSALAPSEIGARTPREPPGEPNGMPSRPLRRTGGRTAACQVAAAHLVIANSVK